MHLSHRKEKIALEMLQHWKEDTVATPDVQHTEQTFFWSLEGNGRFRALGPECKKSPVDKDNEKRNGQDWEDAANDEQVVLLGRFASCNKVRREVCDESVDDGRARNRCGELIEIRRHLDFKGRG